jgi:hypothetical protein
MDEPGWYHGAQLADQSCEDALLVLGWCASALDFQLAGPSVQ